MSQFSALADKDIAYYRATKHITSSADLNPCIAQPDMDDIISMSHADVALQVEIKAIRCTDPALFMKQADNGFRQVDNPC